jgi:hypothetical protein
MLAKISCMAAPASSASGPYSGLRYPASYSDVHPSALRPIGRLSDPSLRSPLRHFHSLACLLPDRPGGDLGVLARRLDVPGDLGTLIGGMLMLTVDGFRA